MVWQNNVDYWLLSYPRVRITDMRRSEHILDIFLILFSFLPFNACLHLRYCSLTLKANSLWDEVGKINPSEFGLGEKGSPQPQTPPFTIVEVTPPNHG